MRSKPLVLSLLILLPSVLSAQSNVRTVAEATKRPIHRFADVEIVLERTYCFGNCPAYRVQVCGHDFSVRYGGEAEERARELDLRSSVTSDELVALLNAFYRQQFFDLPDEYDLTPYIFHAYGNEFVVLEAYTTDAPSTFLELRDGSRFKRIRLRTSVPPELAAIVDLIDKTTGTAALLQKRGANTPPN